MLKAFLILKNTLLESLTSKISVLLTTTHPKNDEREKLRDTVGQTNANLARAEFFSTPTVPPPSLSLY